VHLPDLEHRAARDIHGAGLGSEAKALPTLNPTRLTEWTMVRQVTRCSLALLLFALSLSSPAVTALAEDEIPDLRVEFLPLPLPNDERNVRFRVTNISTWWADETTLAVQTVSPGPPNPAALFVENLDLGQSTIVTYTLAAGCDAHEVVAVLVPAKNHAGVLEITLANNRAPEAESRARVRSCAAPGLRGSTPARRAWSPGDSRATWS
jgi:hypothetical protein